MNEFIIIHNNRRDVMTIPAADVCMIDRMTAGDFYNYNEETLDNLDLRNYDMLTVFYMRDGNTRTITTDCQIICR